DRVRGQDPVYGHPARVHVGRGGAGAAYVPGGPRLNSDRRHLTRPTAPKHATSRGSGRGWGAFSARHEEIDTTPGSTSSRPDSRAPSWVPVRATKRPSGLAATSFSMASAGRYSQVACDATT